MNTVLAIAYPKCGSHYLASILKEITGFSVFSREAFGGTVVDAGYQYFSKIIIAAARA
jgi:hypothetical protein